MKAFTAGVLLMGAAAAIAVVAVPRSDAQTLSLCSSKKKDCVAKKTTCLLKCHTKAEQTGLAVDPGCTQKCMDKFDGGDDPAKGCFARLEARDDNCLTFGDTTALEAKVDAFVLDVVQELDPAFPTPVRNKCSAGKKKCVSDKTKALLKCHAKAERKGVVLDPVCIQKAENKFDGGSKPSAGCFEKRETKNDGPCPTFDDTAAFEAKVDAFVSDVVAELDPTFATPTPTLSPTPTMTATPGTPTATATPEPPACGDGSADGAEECDDGGIAPGDGCSPTCELESLNPALCAGVPAVAGTSLAKVLVASGYDAPVHVAAPRLDPSRVFVVEQDGRIQLIKDGVQLGAPFLAIEGIVLSGGEQGLLSVAFHPDYETNRRFFVYYNNNAGDLEIARYEATLGNPDDADESSAHIVHTIPHPGQGNHNGGNLNFGPDGFLYAATGDGGGGGDPSENAQNDLSQLGKLLRIDPETDAVTTWGKGLRNPYRFSFDRANGDIYIGDVGQGRWEEISYSAANPSGVNYGWDDMEGRHCFEPLTGCLTAGRTPPVLEYCNSGFSDAACSAFQPEKGQAVTGGFVYRGCAMPDVHGRYFYSDFYTAFIRSFLGVSGGDAQSLQSHALPGAGSIGNVSSFGEDARGEIYIVDYDGDIFRIVPGS